MNYDLVGIGNALVDIEVRVDPGFIEQLGLRKGGMTLTTAEEQRRILDLLPHQPTKISSGGSAANTVHGLSVLGGSAYYLGRVANDEYGRHYTEDMKTCGVGFPGPGTESEGTGTCLVLITPDTERTMMTHLGVSAGLHPDNVDETILRFAKTVYIEGYLWTGEETRQAAVKMAETAQRNKIPVAFTLSDTFVVDLDREALDDFIRWHVDILFCNEPEARAMTGEDDTERAFAMLRGMADTVFLTRGDRGSWGGNQSGEKHETRAFPITAVDTTGAGDLYAAGVLHALIQGFGLKDAAAIGS
ncbi:MAG: adenosine kinase, partial [Nitrospinaceae bacterium]|nr:adenosine kinase [Nitrospinaceae bacterium]NIS86579.1 adenosine kinase [Nitrospinaceae bacterium]NIT83413.1 adenosine kinase [Nitrospinaceae bacterium]NIU97780.1 adenosine kinase [Nitrospinaceae bacterium]NIY16755.1 adenosine kinase [Nitrospinaceae bacterium]